MIPISGWRHIKYYHYWILDYISCGFLGIAYVFHKLALSLLEFSQVRYQTRVRKRWSANSWFDDLWNHLFLPVLSLVGTVLAIWADQSWGRFWGWDAKENGALLIIWNAILLHARWSGIAKFGIA